MGELLTDLKSHRHFGVFLIGRIIGSTSVFMSKL